MSIQQNYPAIKPTLNLDFANTKQLDPRITYSRASTGTYYDGKAVAKAEENLLLWSQEFQNTGWLRTGVAIAADTSIAPDGTTTADTLTASAGSNFHLTQRLASVVANQNHTYTVYAKYATAQYIAFGFASGALGVAWAFVTVDIQNGTITQTTNGASSVAVSGAVTPVGNGWYRITVTGNHSQTDTYPTIHIVNTSTPSFGNFGAFTWTAAGTESVLLWGAQLEQRSFATAYTPTTTAPITNYIPVLQTASAGTPRFDHNPITGESLGLLIEEQRTNLVTYSQDFDNAAWTKNAATIAANTIVAPDGTLTGDKLVEGTTTDAIACSRTGLSFTAANTLTFYAKAGERRYVFIRCFASVGNYGNVTFDLQTGLVAQTNSVGVVTATGAITAVSNGWYRLSVTASSSATAVVTAGIVLSNTATPTFSTAGVLASPYTGDGFSGIYIWGAQLEVGAFATSYIPTALTYSGRASAATFRGANGLIQTAAINAPRYEVNAGGGSNLLLENASSNLLTRTEDFGSSDWGKYSSVVTSNTAIAPDGSFTALSGVATGTGPYVEQTKNSTALTHTISVWLQGVGSSIGKMPRLFLVRGEYAEAVSSTTVPVLTGQWQRYTFTGTFSAAPTTVKARVDFAGYPATAGDTVLIWGAQLEAGSAVTSYIPSLETFTGRASTATYYDSTGIVRTAASGQPRYSYNPQLLSAPPKLLLEAQGTNLLIRSEEFDNAAWAKTNSTITTNAAISPDGTLDADKLNETAVTSTFSCVAAPTMASSTVYTLSLYMKAAERNFGVLNIYTGTSSCWTTYDLSTGVISTLGAGATATMTPVGNGWYRCTLTISTASSGTPNIGIWPAISNNVLNYAGTAGSGILLWGAQLEAGSSATSYIPTAASQVTRVADTSTSAAQSRAADVYSSAQVTRAADSASMTGTNFSSWYNQGEGTLYCAADSNVANLGSYAYFVSDSLGNNYYRATNNTTTLSLQSGAAGSNVVNLDAVQAGMITGISYPNAYAYQRGSFAGVVRNGTVRTSANTTMPLNLNQMAIGSSGFGGAQINGHIQRIAYYPRRLTNTQLQSLTS